MHSEEKIHLPEQSGSVEAPTGHQQPPISPLNMAAPSPTARYSSPPPPFEAMPPMSSVLPPGASQGQATGQIPHAQHPQQPSATPTGSPPAQSCGQTPYMQPATQLPQGNAYAEKAFYGSSQTQVPHWAGPVGPAPSSLQPMQQLQDMQYVQVGMQQPMLWPQATGARFQNPVALPNLGMSASPVDCPRCGQRDITKIRYKPGNTTHAWALGVFCLTCSLCFIPYLMNSLKDVEHQCGKCGAVLATWHKSGAVEVHAH